MGLVVLSFVFLLCSEFYWSIMVTVQAPTLNNDSTRVNVSKGYTEGIKVSWRRGDEYGADSFKELSADGEAGISTTEFVDFNFESISAGSYKVAINGAETEFYTEGDYPMPFYSVHLGEGSNFVDVSKRSDDEYYNIGRDIYDYDHIARFTIHYRNPVARNMRLLGARLNLADSSSQMIFSGSPSRDTTISMKGTSTILYTDEFGIAYPSPYASREMRGDSLLSGMKFRFKRRVDVYVDKDGNIERCSVTAVLPTDLLLLNRLVNSTVDRLSFIYGTFGVLEPLSQPGTPAVDEPTPGVRSGLDPSLTYKAVTTELSREIIQIGPANRFNLRSSGSGLGSSPMFSSLDSIVFHVPEDVIVDVNQTLSTRGKDKAIGGYHDLNQNGIVATFKKRKEQNSVTNIDKRSIPLPDNLSDLIKQFQGKLTSTPFMYSTIELWNAFFRAIPLIWFLLLFRKHVSDLKPVVTTYSWIIFILLFAHFLQPVTQTLTSLVVTLTHFVISQFSESAYYQASGMLWLYSFLSLALFSITAVVMSTGAFARRPRLSRGTSIFVAVLTVVFVVTGGTWLTLQDDANNGWTFEWYRWLFSLIPGVVAISVMYFCLHQILRHVAGLRPNFGFVLALTFTWLATPVVLDQIFKFKGSETADQLLVIFYTILGTCALYCFVIILRHIFIPNSINRNRVIWYLALLCLSTALPKSLLFQPSNVGIEYYGQYFFPLYLFDLIPFIVLCMAVVILYRCDVDFSNTEKLFSNLKQSIGIFLISVFIVGYHFDYLFVPTSMVLAYFFSRLFLFNDPEQAKKKLVASTDIFANRKLSLTRLIQNVTVRRQSNILQKGLDKQLGEGGLSYEDWKTKSEENKARRELVRTEVEPVQEAVFSHGLGKSPWENAMISIRTGAWLAIPWIFLFIRTFLAEKELDGVFPLLSVADSFIQGIACWFVMSFVFGYYFEAIKGATGVEKGLRLSLVVISSVLLPAVIFSGGIAEVARLMTWCLQVFIFNFLLGFIAFDLRLLRKHGMGWREIETIYNLTFLSTSASALIAALIGILSGQIQDLFKAGLGILFKGTP